MKKILIVLLGLFFLSSCEKEVELDATSPSKKMVQVNKNDAIKVLKTENFGIVLSFPTRNDVYNIISSWATTPLVQNWETKLNFPSMRRNGTSEQKRCYNTPVQLFLNNHGYIMIGDTIFKDTGDEVFYYDFNQNRFNHYCYNNTPQTRAITESKTIKDEWLIGDPLRPQDGYYLLKAELEFDKGNWLSNAIVIARTQIFSNGSRYNASNLGVFYAFDIDVNGKNCVKTGRFETSRTYTFEEYLIKEKTLEVGYVYTTHYAKGGKDDIDYTLQLRME